MPTKGGEPFDAVELTVDVQHVNRTRDRRRRATILGALVAACMTACDQSAAPPSPPRSAAAPPTIDVRHYASVSGDRPLTISNVVWIVQGRDKITGQCAVTLMSEDTGAATARLMFGDYVTVESDEDWARLRIDFGGAPYLDLTGNGVFTRIAAYQPKLAQLSIETAAGDEVKGVIRGEFYRIRYDQRKLRAETVDLEIAFLARVVTR